MAQWINCSLPQQYTCVSMCVSCIASLVQQTTSRINDRFSRGTHNIQSDKKQNLTHFSIITRRLPMKQHARCYAGPESMVCLFPALGEGHWTAVAACVAAGGSSHSPWRRPPRPPNCMVRRRHRPPSVHHRTPSH